MPTAKKSDRAASTYRKRPADPKQVRVDLAADEQLRLRVLAAAQGKSMSALAREMIVRCMRDAKLPKLPFEAGK